MRNYCFAGLTVVGLVGLASVVLWSASPATSEAHCQVPCGIYDDAARIARLREDTATIAKATKQIADMAGGHGALAINQGVRWINTKELHASHIIEVVSQYFLTQKVKPVATGAAGYDAYLAKLADHHAVMVAAMKTKQQVDPAAVTALEGAIDALAQHYK
ncbi:MAG: superoxide dismutase [Planctomycetes bacterium]|nr:superoxide dismutase [Planctomycetota bacterium]